MSKKIQPTNACLWTLLKKMIVQERKGHHSFKLNREDYSAIATVIYNNDTKTGYLEKVFRTNGEESFVRDYNTLNSLVSFLKHRFGYKDFEDFAKKHNDEYIVNKYQEKLFKYRKNYSFSEQDEFDNWAKDKCIELFKEPEIDLIEVSRKNTFNSKELALISLELLKECRNLETKMIAADLLLNELKYTGEQLSISKVEQKLPNEQFLLIYEVIKFYEKIAIYKQDDCLSENFICENDRLKIRYWFRKHLKELFENENSRFHAFSKGLIFSLATLLPKIDELSDSKSLLFRDKSDFSFEKWQWYFSRKQTIERITSLNSFLTFRWDDPGSYFLMKEYKAEVWDILKHIENIGAIENIDSFLLRRKFSDYLFMIGNKTEAMRLRKYNELLLRKVFNSKSEDFNKEERLYMHNDEKENYLNNKEVLYCKEIWGLKSVQALESLTCHACLLIGFGFFEEAKDVLKEGESIKDFLNLNGSQIDPKKYHIPMNWGKVFFNEAKLNEKSDRNKMKSLLTDAITYFKFAQETYELSHSDHVSKNYVYYYLFQCYKMLDLYEDAEKEYFKCKVFFENHPIVSMCDVDRNELLLELKINKPF